MARLLGWGEEPALGNPENEGFDLFHTEDSQDLSN